MTTDVIKYILPLDTLDLSKILSTWTWLTGKNMDIVALTKAGDALLKDDQGYMHFLDTGNGTMNLISKDYKDFLENKLSENVLEELLLPKLIDRLDRNNIKLKVGQVYSYTMLPILGGMYDEKNMFALDLYEHYNLTGEIHLQLKDMPNGTEVEIDVTE
jgi:hypothetical protein